MQRVRLFDVNRRDSQLGLERSGGAVDEIALDVIRAGVQLEGDYFAAFARMVRAGDDVAAGIQQFQVRIEFEGGQTDRNLRLCRESEGVIVGIGGRTERAANPARAAGDGTEVLCDCEAQTASTTPAPTSASSSAA